MTTRQTPDFVREGLEQRKAINTVLGRLLASLVPDVVERIRIGNEACTAIVAALKTPDDVREASPYVAGPIWAETEDNCFTAEIQTVGGHSVIATVHGSTRDEAEQRQLAILAALVSRAGDAGEVELRPMLLAPKDGSYILARYNNDYARDRDRHYNGRWFVIRHPGASPGEYDLGWNLFPGYGGVPDFAFDGWLPLPAVSASLSPGEAGRG